MKIFLIFGSHFIEKQMFSFCPMEAKKFSSCRLFPKKKIICHFMSYLNKKSLHLCEE